MVADVTIENAASDSNTPAPAEFEINLVAFVPFLARDVTPEVVQVGPADEAGKGAVLAFAKMLEDLKLWGYSDDVTKRLRTTLPHRVRTWTLPTTTVGLRTERAECIWHEESRRLELWDIGVGLVTLVYRMEHDPTVTWRQIRSSIASVDNKQTILDRAAESAEPLIAGRGGVAEPDRPAPPFDRATPLWVQEVFVVQAKDRTTLRVLDRVAGELAEHSSRLEVQEVTEEYSLRLGVEACIVGNPGAHAVSDALSRVVAAQTAVWTAALEFDFVLAGLLDTGGSEARTLALDEVQGKSPKLLAVFEEVQRFRSDIEIIPLHLAAPDRELWEWLNKEWALDKQLAALDGKLSAVEHVYTHLINTMMAKESQFLNKVVLAITMLSFATFWLTVWEFTRKAFVPFNWSSAMVVLGALVSAASLFYFVGWWSGRLMGPRLRDRRRTG
jgi:hypothetical protein